MTTKFTKRLVFFLFAACSSVVVANNDTPRCRDLQASTQCREWKWFGECKKNPAYMNEHCAKTCGICEADALEIQLQSKCTNAFHSCQEWADNGKCHGIWTSKKGGFDINAAYIVEFCPKACNVCDIHLDERDMSLNLGLPQEAPGMEDDRHLFHLLRAKVQEVRHYVSNLENKQLREACKMAHPKCARFSLATDCEDFADHEIIKYGCAAACMTCENLEKENNGIAKAEAFWSKALREYEEKQQQSFTMKET
ncbi:ShK domain-like protein [Nitzschia inconspicua]|uniref:ShK domain-like protein n=1 Tax=Nitzschia inconspicua TaxID=303405 RepID=A0A9K3K8Y6_9STRA|nr:ShK domain-like protein [Nitzschia inconspicua]KAG7362146.1 ShK domain-like protein [Nitzschia inconspicua]